MGRKVNALLRCPCGTERTPVPWRAGSKSYRYRLRCLRCGLESKVAATLNEPHEMDRHWNEAVKINRIARGKVPHG
jgi:hypothetical protein